MVARGSFQVNITFMTQVEELVIIAKSLPKKSAEELVDFARFLQKKKIKKRPLAKRRQVDGDKEWERIINSGKKRPALKKLIAEVRADIRAGKTEPMDFDRL